MNSKFYRKPCHPSRFFLPPPLTQAELRGADERRSSKLQDSERDREQLLEQGKELVALQQTVLMSQSISIKWFL